MRRSDSSRTLALAALISLSFVAFLGKSSENLLRGIDSNIHAKAAMDVTSDGWRPVLPIPDSNSGGAPPTAAFNDHPFFYFYINGWVMRILGPSGWSARVLTATFSSGCVILTYALGSTLLSSFFGFLSALIFLLTRDVILTGATVSLDPPMLFFILLSFLGWIRGNWLWLGFAAGLGLWFKTPVVLLVYPTAAVVTVIERSIRQKPRMSWKHLTGAAAISLAIGSCIWIFSGATGGWQLVADYWYRQVWGTAIQGRSLGYSGHDWTLFFRFLRLGFIPGLPLLILGLIQIARTRQWKNPTVLISLIVIGILVPVITLMRFRMGYYLNPVFPFLAFLSAHSVFAALLPYEEIVYRIFVVISLVISTVALCTPITFGPEAFVALKRFIPIIQAQGDCRDPIVLVPGGEPVGSTQDYQFVLNFYTGRRVDVVTCDKATEAILRTNPAWMILSRENYEKCLGRSQTLPEISSRIQASYRVGSQSLLGFRATGMGMGMALRSGDRSEVDLTPLEREFMPVVDCHPPPYPQDIYHRY